MIAKFILSFSAAILVTAPAGYVSAKTPIHATTEAAVRTFVDKTVVRLKERRAIRVLSEHLAEFDGALRQKLMAVTARHARSDWNARADGEADDLVTHYLTLYVPSASDEAIFRMVKNESDRIGRFSNDPRACAAYVRRDPAFLKANIPDYNDTEDSADAAVFDSAFTAPVRRDLEADRNTILSSLAAAYQKNGYDMRDLGLLGKAAGVPDTDVCRANVEFDMVLLALGPKDSALILASVSAAMAKSKS